MTDTSNIEIVLTPRLLVEKTKLSAERDLLLERASSFCILREKGDICARRAAGLESARLRKEARDRDRKIKLIAEAISLLGPIAPSLNRRLAMVHYHYNNWMAVEKTGLTAARIVSKLGGDGYVNTPAYNAEVIAFLQNVHALCDSLPYILNLYFRVHDFSYRKIGWNKITLNLLEDAARETGEENLSTRLKEFSKNDLFIKLQDLVNCAKHKHLIPIFFHEGRAVFAKLDGKWLPSSLEVHQFLLRIDNELIPLVWAILRIAAERAFK